MTDCVDDRGRCECVGSAYYRPALDSRGESYARCARHWADLLARHRAVRRRYPDLDVPPADLDPGYAGGRRYDDPARRRLSYAP